MFHVHSRKGTAKGKDHGPQHAKPTIKVFPWWALIIHPLHTKPLTEQDTSPGSGPQCNGNQRRPLAQQDDRERRQSQAIGHILDSQDNDPR